VSLCTITLSLASTPYAQASRFHLFSSGQGSDGTCQLISKHFMQLVCRFVLGPAPACGAVAPFRGSLRSVLRTLRPSRQLRQPLICHSDRSARRARSGGSIPPTCHPDQAKRVAASPPWVGGIPGMAARPPTKNTNFKFSIPQGRYRTTKTRPTYIPPHSPSTFTL
jgi:hypothetical protein